jgi:hypothetical protein
MFDLLHVSSVLKSVANYSSVLLPYSNMLGYYSVLPVSVISKITLRDYTNVDHFVIIHCLLLTSLKYIF